MARKTIGITGTMGTGKSTVARIIKSLGGKQVLLLDADRITRKFLKRGSDASKMVVQFFPDAMDEKGNIDRKKLADAVFSSKGKLGMLNSLIHPFVVRAVRQRLEKVREDFVVLDVPLLVEADMLGMVDALVIVDAEKSVVIRRSRFSRKEIERREASQMPLAQKKKLAVKKLGEKNVFVIDNSRSRGRTKECVKEIWKTISRRE